MKTTVASKEIIESQAFELQNLSSSWFYSIRNCVEQKKPESAILIYSRNHGNGSIGLDSIPSVLKACASLFNHRFGTEMHCESIKSGVEGDVMVGTSLVDMYGKCGDIVSSRKVFDYMPERNVVTWNAMIGGYVRNGDMGSALGLFETMEGRTSATWNEMIGGYAKNGDVAMARRVFESVPEGLKNVVTWTVMVDGYVRNGDMEAAEEVFEVMPERNFYVCSVIISGYFRKGDVVKGKGFFDRMFSRNLVCWNTLIAGYAQNGMCAEALDAFMNMGAEGIKPDEVTVVSVLSVCAQSGMLEVGKEIHEMIVQKGIDLNEYVVNGLVDMYAKCGDLGNARLIFEGIPSKNYATWNSLIAGFSIHGHCKEALEFFMRMEKSGIKADGVTILSVLSACAHGGLVEEGLAVFSKMEQYGLTANTKHYGCVVHMLGRAGKLQEAMDLVEGMPVLPNDTVLGSLLGACQIHSDAVMADKVLELVGKLNSDYRSNDNGHYLVLANIYAACERWEAAERLRAVFADKGSDIIPGCSAIT
ncbi:pentatricopeptide repeat-containing protein At3g21470 [Primulina huaijiensis]|uniref:pentatricopeptide repeat-containing protein At3g21470 n=1 Tax=Primulina huaijiensis TaxID=1492673 RepID=UPI003CC70E8F